MKKSKLEEVGLTFPSGIWLIFFFMIPTTIIFLYAFKSADIYGGINDGWTMKNIYQLFTPFNLKILARTVYFAAITTIICLSLALPFAHSSPFLDQFFNKSICLEVSASSRGGVEKNFSHPTYCTARYTPTL